MLNWEGLGYYWQEIGGRSREVGVFLFFVVYDFIARDIFFNRLVFRVEKPCPAFCAELALVIDNGLAIRTFFQGHAYILLYLKPISYMSLTSFRP